MKARYYRKKPVIIEAIQLKKNDESINYFRDELLWNTKTDLYTTEEGEDWDIKWGEYIVKDKSGEIYIVRPDVFQMFLKRIMK